MTAEQAIMLAEKEIDRHLALAEFSKDVAIRQGHYDVASAVQKILNMLKAAYGTGI